ncbi:hypothetical protein BJ980_001545 [Nocardioides daedukensis]|uniref:Uncharacterized protein n=1 Tax=Nocardioides daedukensis TaxID=634462 RepID=A0A7Y9S178_9ACTN|nr:hypothetical protein [Nocardioides daedukensis]NYG58622.1 hypothetical protein [Nocardioides daedukensis]
MSQDVLDTRPGFGRSFFGPLSVVAMAIGLSLSAFPWFTDVPGASMFAFLPPLLGAAMLGLRGQVRHFGTGLALSILGAPVFYLVFLLAVNVAGLVG